MAQEFRSLGASRLLITRLDTVKRLGSLLRIVYESHLPLANYSASAKVTEPPQPMNPVALARLILKAPGSQTATQPQETSRAAHGAAQ